jgi:hypothetical protein
MEWMVGRAGGGGDKQYTTACTENIKNPTHLMIKYFMPVWSQILVK